MSLLNGALPADLAAPHLEAERLHAMTGATDALNRSRELLYASHAALREALDADRARREGYQAGLAALLADGLRMAQTLHETVRRHDACAVQLAQAERALEESRQQVDTLMAVRGIEPKLKRIEELIKLLDRAELIQWHR